MMITPKVGGYTGKTYPVGMVLFNYLQTIYLEEAEET